MDCKKAQSLVTPYVKQELDENQTEEFLEHISGCPECHEELEIYFTIYFALKKLDEDQDVSYNIKQMLEEDLETTRTRLRARKLFRLFSYVIMVMAEVLLVFCLLTQFESWTAGGMKNTFLWKRFYASQSVETEQTEKAPESEMETEPVKLVILSEDRDIIKPGKDSGRWPNRPSPRLK